MSRVSLNQVSHNLIGQCACPCDFFTKNINEHFERKKERKKAINK